MSSYPGGDCYWEGLRSKIYLSILLDTCMVMDNGIVPPFVSKLGKMSPPDAAADDDADDDDDDDDDDG